MKQNRFLGIFLAGFMVLSISYSSNVMAMEAFDDAFSEVTVGGERCLVDADGNVLRSVTDDQLAALRDAYAESAEATLEGLSKSVDGMGGKFLTKDSPWLKQLPTVDKELLAATQKELNENLIRRVSGQKLSGLSDYSALDVTRDMNNAAQKAVQDATASVTKNVDDVVSDFKKPGKEFTNGKLAAKYINRFKNLSKSAIEEINKAVKSGERLDVEEACLNAAKENALSGISQHLVEGEGITDDAINLALKDATAKLEARFATLTADMNKLAADTEGKLLTEFKSGISEDLDSADAAFGKNESAIQGKQDTLLDKLGVLQKDVFTGFGEDASILKKRFSNAIGTNPALQGMADKLVDFGSEIKGGLKGIGKEITFKNAGAFLKSIVMTLGMAVLFMIPNIVQSTFLAHKMREVELQTLAAPIQYGNWVFQIPISCFNLENPSATIPIYVRIPVSDATQTVSPAAGLAYKNSVSGLASDNVISRSIAGNATRYHIKEAQYYTYNPGIIVAYFNSYQDWGSVPLTSSQFTSGQVIDLTTGMIIDDSGESISATGIKDWFDAYPLIAPLDWHPSAPQPALSPEDVRKALPQLLSKLSLAGDVHKYIDYISVTSGATGSKNSASLQSLFDCSCMDSSSITPCPAGSPIPNSGVCMITKMLDRYKGGLSFNADGTVGSESAETSGTQPTQGVSEGAAAPNPNLLGSVIPLYGWGDTGFANLINQTNFPGFTPAPGTNPLADANKNYSALGCWVYLSASTPFAQAVANNNIKNSVTGSYVDYIIFLDLELNQVPLMIPVENPHYVAGTTTLDYTTTKLGLNPKVAYWTSIAAFDNTTGNALNLPGCADPSTGYPIMYTLAGAPYPATGGEPNLAGVAGQSTAPGIAVISSAIADLAAHFYQNSLNLSGQFSVHQQAMVNQLNRTAFNYGGVSLTQSEYNITVPGSSASAPAQAVITLYEGPMCYGTTSVPDLLVAWDSVQSMTTTLPNVNATEFFSLVTDIAYTVASDGSLVPSTSSANAAIPVGFGSAPLTQNAGTPVTYSLNEQALTTYYVLDTFIEKDLLEGAYPLSATGTPYVQLCNGDACSGAEMSVSAYVAQQRDAWASAFDTTGQMEGITIGALTFNLPSQFNATQAVANGAFIYNVTPSPSAALCQNDLFIIVKTPTPAASDLADPINAVIVNPATTSHYALSLVTGFIFDMQGNQQNHASGAPRRITIPSASLTALAASAANAAAPTATIASTIYNTMTGNSEFDLSTIAPGFEAVYQGYVTQYQAQMQRPMGPYTFGDFDLGILTEDDAIGNFVYFSPTAGMHDMTTFEPSDFLITYDGTGNPSAWTSSTTQMMSIISGNLYDNNGNILSTLPAAEIVTATATLEPMWSSWLKGKVKTLQAAMTAQLAAAEAEQTKLDNLEAAIIAQPTTNLSQANVSTMIARLIPGPDASGNPQGLPAPYKLLQYDPLLQHFVHVSPASAAEATQIYLFFDVGPDTPTVGHPTPLPLGGVYSAAGNLQTILKGVTLQVMKDKYGVVVNADGTQSLALPLLQPSFRMLDATETLTPGSDSANGDLICSTSATFPGGSIVMPKGYYLYYSMTMQAYYVWDIKRSRWISVVADNQGRGHVYAQDGSPIKWAGKVAFSTSSSSTDGIAAADDMILLYENGHDNMQGYMSNGKNYLNLVQTTLPAGSPMTWTPLKGSTALAVRVNADGTKYTIGDTVYKVNTSKTAPKWYKLACVPAQDDLFDSSGNVRPAPIKSAYQEAELVMNGSTPTHLLFHGVMYKVSSSAGASAYTMVPVESTKTGSVKMTLGGTDPNTNAPFVTVTDASKNTYTYIYAFDSLSEVQFTTISAIFAGTTATATRAFAVGATDAMTTNVLFAQNIPTNSSGLALTPLKAGPKTVLNTPVPDSPGYTGFNSTQFGLNLEQISKSTDGRYFAQLQPWTGASQNNVLSFASAQNGAYVDLHTGILYNTENGISYGYSLALNDLLTVLNYYQVSMAYGKLPGASEKTLNLVYRTPTAISSESALFADRVNPTT